MLPKELIIEIIFNIFNSNESIQDNFKNVSNFCKSSKFIYDTYKDNIYFIINKKYNIKQYKLDNLYNISPNDKNEVIKKFIKITNLEYLYSYIYYIIHRNIENYSSIFYINSNIRLIIKHKSLFKIYNLIKKLKYLQEKPSKILIDKSLLYIKEYILKLDKNQLINEIIELLNL